MKILYNNTEVLDVQVDDNSYRYRAIKGDHNLTLYFSLAEHIEIPVGAYCVYENETYTLEKPESLTMKHSRYFEYTVVFDSPQAKAGKWKFRNPVDKRLKFPLTAKPIEHLQMFVDNMNLRDSGWTVGRCIDAPEKTISYNHAYCIDALSQMADEWETEYEFVGKQVSLWKIEYNKDNPLPLSYGKGNGFKPGIGRSNYEDSTPIEILYTQGGTQNINASKYGCSELLLPKNQTIRFDGEHFEDEPGFDNSQARTYQTDAEGLSIRRADKALFSQAEDSLDCSEIYPSRVGTISNVTEVDASKNFYDISDSSIPESLNFEECLIEGETLTIIPQTGMLAGKEFEVKYIHDAIDGKAARRFEIVPQEIDGMTMPGGVYIPREGDTYAVFHCMLPDSYICDNETKTGASWEMCREAVNYLYDNEEQKFTFTGELDGIWAKKDWLNIGGRIKLGGFIQFSDERFQPEGVLVRIIGIKDYINNPHSPEIELSNSTVGRTVSSDLQKIESNEVVMDTLHKEALQFTKRRYRDAQETIEMLGNALLDNFSNSINPIAVQTMAMLVGDKSLQFEFVNSMTNPTPVAHNVTYNQAKKVLSIPSGIIQHYTLGIDTISSNHATNEYMFWSLPAFTTPTMTDGTKKYYLYAKVSRTAQSGTFYISEQAIALESVDGFYHLLMGILNSEYDGERSYVSLYGFTEVLPGQIRTNKILSSDGRTYFDLLLGEIGGNIKFNSTDGSLKEISKLESMIGDQNKVYTTQPIPPYKTGDVWANGNILLKCTTTRTEGEYHVSDWVEAVSYDNTTTTINGGIVTSGTIQLAGGDGGILAGVTGEGSKGTSVRFWAGSTKENKETAPFRVLQDGTLYASKGVFAGYLQTPFVHLDDSDAEWNASKHVFQIHKNLNLVSSGLSDTFHAYEDWIELPYDESYIGARISILNDKFPPYTKLQQSFAKTVIVVAEESTTDGVGIGGRPKNGMPDETDPNAIAFIARVVELLCVPHPVSSHPYWIVLNWGSDLVERV